MSEPTTLGEALTKWESIGSVTFGQAGGSIEAFTKDLRRILYGTDKPCPVCLLGTNGPSGLVQVADHELSPCLRCAGSGRLKTPGLVDRVEGEVHGSVLGYAGQFRAALRREIGEATP